MLFFLIYFLQLQIIIGKVTYVLEPKIIIIGHNLTINCTFHDEKTLDKYPETLVWYLNAELMIKNNTYTKYTNSFNPQKYFFSTYKNTYSFTTINISKYDLRICFECGYNNKKIHDGIVFNNKTMFAPPTNNSVKLSIKKNYIDLFFIRISHYPKCKIKINNNTYNVIEKRKPWLGGGMFSEFYLTFNFNGTQYCEQEFIIICKIFNRKYFMINKTKKCIKPIVKETSIEIHPLIMFTLGGICFGILLIICIVIYEQKKKLKFKHNCKFSDLDKLI